MNVLDCSDPAALVRALEALPQGTWVLVITRGQRHLVQRVPGGWHLPGDMAVASADVADGRPAHVEVLADVPDTDIEALMLLADLDADEAADLQAWKDSKR